MVMTFLSLRAAHPLQASHWQVHCGDIKELLIMKNQVEGSVSFKRNNLFRRTGSTNPSYHIREKSKQVITLLMDEKMLYKEREVACRTRRRTSYSMTFPKRLPSTGNSPTACASAPTPEIPASEKKHQLLKVARLRSKKKAGLKQEQHQDMQSPGDTVLSQEILPLKINAWKSTEDLMLFYDEDPNPLLPTVPPSIISSTRWLSEGQAEVCNLWDTDAVPTPSEKSPSLQTNVSLDKKSENTITSTIAENPLQTRQAALPAFWSSSKEEFISPNERISKSDSTFYDQSSVETLYVSPSFKTCHPAKEIVINKDLQKPVQASVIQKHDADLKTPTTWGESTSKHGFSKLSLAASQAPQGCHTAHTLFHTDMTKCDLYAGHSEVDNHSNTL
ncbi:ENTH domain-containing protein 1 [Sciurus carolinensis]|uniref:ENTH domain-containing protein 1 n=1 Tax=Sciurus carolinensis TaxID=30640 RepID=A0AA41MS28_SCICA|nr:ENTH domain-containing protein 1 [Sciurus carolinensis]